MKKMNDQDIISQTCHKIASKNSNIYQTKSWHKNVSLKKIEKIFDFCLSQKCFLLFRSVTQLFHGHFCILNSDTPAFYVLL